MVQSRAVTVSQYLVALPPERRNIIEQVRAVIVEHLPNGVEERMGFGMISYEIPLARYPKTYNGKPLVYAALAAQKRYYSIYLMSAYADSDVEQQLREDFDRAGKKLDMGKCCVRFRSLEDLPLEAIGRAVAATSVESYLALYERSRTGKS